ncbi:MAG: protein-L-isoaspartate(D-aspartate) O-methyltransferase [bacterium]
MCKSQRTILTAIVVLLALVPTTGWSQPETPEMRREQLVENYLKDPRHGTPVTDTRVLDAIRRVPRHRFVPKRHRDRAYRNTPLPIGQGQTISQPYIVGIMTQLLELEPGDRVLEVGTGSGYHAAVLAEIAADVYSIEIIPDLARTAKKRLKKLTYDTVTVRQGDGYYGWPEKAPFDAIVVTAAPSHIPPPLMEQLKPWGRMVIPVGSQFRVQQLMVVTKRPDGSFRKRGIMPVRFVPFTRSSAQD